MSKKKATVNYYVVRIYRKDMAPDAEASGLTGLVETESGARQAFHNAQELWRILQRDWEEGHVFSGPGFRP